MRDVGSTVEAREERLGGESGGQRSPRCPVVSVASAPAAPYLILGAPVAAQPLQGTVPFASFPLTWCPLDRCAEAELRNREGPTEEAKDDLCKHPGSLYPCPLPPKPKWEQPTESHQLRPWWKREVADGQAWRVRSRNVTTCPRPGGTSRPQHTPAQRPD